MKTLDLLKSNLDTLKPRAEIVVRTTAGFNCQSVIGSPEVLNLGVVLLGYYHDPRKVARLSQLGDCLSVGHYLQAPRALKYGRDFKASAAFQKLPAKTQKHLTGEVQDCTIADSRDLGVARPPRKSSDWRAVVKSDPGIQFVYLYQDRQWFAGRVNGQPLNPPVGLARLIKQALKEKA